MLSQLHYLPLTFRSFSILVGAQKFGVRYSTNQTQRGDQLPIYFLESFRFGARARESARGKNAAFVGDVERR